MTVSFQLTDRQTPFLLCRKGALPDLLILSEQAAQGGGGAPFLELFMERVDAVVRDVGQQAQWWWVVMGWQLD